MTAEAPETPDWLPIREGSIGAARRALGLAKTYRPYAAQALLMGTDLLLPGDTIEIVDPLSEPFMLAPPPGWAGWSR